MSLLITDDMDATAIADAASIHMSFRYLPTNGEVGALRWLGSRYAVAEVLLDGLHEDPIGTWVLDIDLFAVADALAADGVDRVPCLDESTRLALIVWCIGPSEAPYEDLE